MAAVSILPRDAWDKMLDKLAQDPDPAAAADLQSYNQLYAQQPDTRRRYNEWAAYGDDIHGLRHAAITTTVDRVVAWLNDELQARGRGTLAEQMDEKHFRAIAALTCYSHLVFYGEDLYAAFLQKQPEFKGQKSYAFHILIGSSSSFLAAPDMDFPGQESVRAMLQRVVAGKDVQVAPGILVNDDVGFIKKTLIGQAVFAADDVLFHRKLASGHASRPGAPVDHLTHH